MKIKASTKKQFDANELMRKRRAEIGKDIEGMSFDEEKKYFQHSAKKLESYRQIGT